MTGISQIIKVVVVLLLASLVSCETHTRNESTEKAGSVASTARRFVQDESRAVAGKDTLLLQELHIVIRDEGNFLQQYKRDPVAFYYPDSIVTWKRFSPQDSIVYPIGTHLDFFYLHDTSADVYILFGDEPGGCIGCVYRIEFINGAALTRLMMPDEIQDTQTYRPHVIELVEWRIVEYPFLQLQTRVSMIREQLQRDGFTLQQSRTSKQVFVKKTKTVTITVESVSDVIKRINLEENEEFL